MTIAVTREQAQALALERERECVSFLEIIKDYRLQNEDSYAQAGEVLKLVKKRMRALDDERTLLVKPLNDDVREINGYFRPATQALEQMAKSLQAMMAQYVKEREAEQVRQLAAYAEKARVDKSYCAKVPVTPLTRLEGIGTRRVTRWEVSDLAAVPREYLTVDSRKVAEALEKGKTIPGIVVVEDIQIVARTK